MLARLQSQKSLTCAFHIYNLKVHMSFGNRNRKSVNTHLLWRIHAKHRSVFFADENFILFYQVKSVLR